MAAGLPLLGSLGSALFGIADAKDQAEWIKLQGAYQAQQSAQNQVLAEMYGKDVLRRGNIEAVNVKKYGNKVYGAQRAAIAAQGIDVNRDDAIAVQSETLEMAARDSARVKANAFREAWGYKVQAMQLGFQGQFQSMSSNAQANSTLLSGYVRGAGSVFGGYSRSYG